jgi:precorrin-6Y C5,15-methyltransferase (decarboxylating)
MSKIFVIGVGYRPLDKRALDALIGSRVILASGRLAEVFKRYAEYPDLKDRLVVINSIDETMNFMKSSLQESSTPITLLASGDPMFFGIGRRVMQEFDRDAVELVPDLSSMQLAFARIKEPWDNALLLSLHGGPNPNRRRNLEYGLRDVPFLLKQRKRVSILTDRVNNPVVIAQTILENSEAAGLQLSGVKMYVCEKIGYPDEKITEGTVSDMTLKTFSDPNVAIIINSAADVTTSANPSNSRLPGYRSSAPIFGLTEDEIAHAGGLITKDEVRAAVIHNLKLPADGILWDIGSGSGSVSIESALMCPASRVFAIEKNPARIENIKINKNRFMLHNIEIIEGSAPDVLSGLPSPDRVFIGGSGGKIGEIIRLIAERMQNGIVVINAATLETFNLALAALRDSAFSVSASQISVSRMKPVGSGHFFAAQNPIFVISGKK